LPVSDLWSLISEQPRRKGMAGKDTQWSGHRAARNGRWLVALAVGLAITLVLLAPAPLIAQDQPTPTATDGFYYTVARGEYWGLIAERFGVTVRELKAANPDLVRYNDVLRVGDQVLIPGRSQPTPTTTPMFQEYVVQPGDGWSLIAERFGLRLGELLDANPELIRYNYVLRTGDRMKIPLPAEAAAAAEPVATATDEPAQADSATPTAKPATPTPAATPTATAPLTTSTTTTTTTAVTTTTAAASGPACPSDFAGYPAQLGEILNSSTGDVEAVTTFLQDCDALTADGLQVGDWTGDGAPDLVVIYADSAQDDTPRRTDLIVFNSSAGGYAEGFRARAAGEVTLFAVADINSDGQPDLGWIDRTCGANTCFDTVEVISWDGSQWRDWTQEALTMAYAAITLADTTPAGQGQEILLDGGVYGSVGAGPQRSRTEVWGSVGGAPYTLLERTYAASPCLYHTVLDANEALLQGTVDGLTRAEALYTQAATDEGLVKCWLHDDELTELRSFSRFRLALTAAYLGQPALAADQIATLAAEYPDSIYAQVGQSWLAAYQESNDIGTACAAVTQFANDNPAAYEPLADYGYANPGFAAADLCPLLDLSALPAPEPVAATADLSTTAALTTSLATSDDPLPDCPADLNGYADTLPALLSVAGGDELIIETWLRQCQGMSDERGGYTLVDANADGAADALFWPTVVSDLGFGPDGAQGDLLIYHGAGEGDYTLVADEEVYGQPTLLAAEDLNGDGAMDLAWQVVGCSTFCVLEVQIVTWDGEAYRSLIAPGATIAEGVARFAAVAAGDPGTGQQLVLAGGVSGASEGGLATPHTEIWQSIDGQPFQRIRWSYDRSAAGNDCMGLRLIEADVALQASPVLGYEPALELYQAAVDPALTACSIFGLPAEEELVLLQGLATFRLIQVKALSGELAAAKADLAALTKGQPQSDYTKAATKWLATYEADEDAQAACTAIEPIVAANAMLWQITDHFGYNHPALAAEQLCYAPSR
jgi:LysM repeat protein